MRSSPSNRPYRILVVFGKGPCAVQGVELLRLFSRAGFFTYAALAETGSDWITAETLRDAGGEFPLTKTALPSWTLRNDPFDLGIVIGLPRWGIRDLFWKASSDPAINQLIQKTNCIFFFQNKEDFFPEWLPVKEKPGAGRWYALPKEQGDFKSFFERGFADILSFLKKRQFTESWQCSLNRTVPSYFSSLAGNSPDWVEELGNQIGMAGFPIMREKAAQDLVFETYEGPFFAGKKMELSLDPNDGDEIPPTRLFVRFIHPEAPNEGVQKFVEKGSIAVCRQPCGDLTLFEKNGPRVLPHLDERSAFNKLLDILIDRLIFDAQNSV